MILKILYKFLLRFSDKENLFGINIYHHSTNNEKEILLNKLYKALNLINEYRPSVIPELTDNIKCILIFGNRSFLGQYVSSMDLIELYDKHLLDPGTSVECIARLIVHEAQHVRLDRLGFTYKEHERERIENICKKAELVFGKRIPNGDEVIAHATKRITTDTAHLYTNISYKKRNFDAMNYHLKKVNCPQLLIKIINWALIKKIQ